MRLRTRPPLLTYLLERGPQNVETMDLPLHEEEMTHHRPPKQPPLPGRDQRAPLQGETGVWFVQQLVLAPPH